LLKLYYKFNFATEPKKLPLASQIHCRSKDHKVPKKVLKRFKKDIKKFGAFCPSQIQKTKRRATTFVVAFYL
jgi:hypothetical protein